MQHPPMHMGPPGPFPGMGPPPMRPMAANPLAMDPNFQYWFHHYGWWHNLVNTQGVHFDIKVARVAYSIAGVLAKDRIRHSDPHLAELLKDAKIKLFDFGLDGDFAVYLENLCSKLEIIKPSEAPVHLTQNKVDPREYIVILSGIAHPQPVETLQALFTYVHEGGRLIMHNCAMYITGALFPGKLGPAPPSTLTKAKIKIISEKELFTVHQNNTEIQLEFYRYPLEVIDKENVSVIAQAKGQRLEPLLVTFKQGYGSVYALTSKMLTTETLVPKDPKQKALSASEAEAYLVSKHASKPTIAAWQCCLKVGNLPAFNTAVASYPSMEILGRIIGRERGEQLKLKEMFPKEEKMEEKIEAPNLMEEESKPSDTMMSEIKTEGEQ